MPKYEYKVVPAPAKGKKAKGVRGTVARFAFALEDLMNQMGAEGWEYQRAETLPSEERHGLTSVTTTYRNMLVFRRPLTSEADQPVQIIAPPQLPPPTVTARESARDGDTSPAGFFSVVRDNGVEDAEEISGPASSLLFERAARLKTPSDPEAPDKPKDPENKTA